MYTQVREEAQRLRTPPAAFSRQRKKPAHPRPNRERLASDLFLMCPLQIEPQIRRDVSMVREAWLGFGPKKPDATRPRRGCQGKPRRVFGCSKTGLAKSGNRDHNAHEARRERSVHEVREEVERPTTPLGAFSAFSQGRRERRRSTANSVLEEGVT